MKKTLAIIFSLVFVIALASCGGKDKKDTTQTEVTETSETGLTEELTGKEERDESTFSETAEETTEKAVKESDWKPVYKKTLENILSRKEILLEKEDVTMSDVCFCLIYLDKDEIPELVVSSGFNHTAKAVLYSFENNAAVRKGNFGSFGKLQYVSLKGLIKSEYSGMGNTETSYYRFENGAVLSLSSVKESSDIYNESAAHKYYINNKEVSADAYKAEREKYESAEEFIDAPSANIPDDSGRLPDGVYYLTPDNINIF